MFTIFASAIKYPISEDACCLLGCDKWRAESCGCPGPTNRKFFVWLSIPNIVFFHYYFLLDSRLHLEIWWMPGPCRKLKTTSKTEVPLVIISTAINHWYPSNDVPNDYAPVPYCKIDRFKGPLLARSNLHDDKPTI